MTYRRKLINMIKKSGRKKVWISNQLGMHRATFWRKAKADKFTDEQKKQIIELLRN